MARARSTTPTRRKKSTSPAPRRPTRSPSPASRTDRQNGTTAHDRLTCFELRAALKLRGLDTTGLKAALVERLSAADARAAAPPSATGTAGPDGAAASLSTMTDAVTAAKGQLVRASKSLRTLSDPNDIYNAWIGAGSDSTTASTTSPTLGHGGVTSIASPPKSILQALMAVLVVIVLVGGAGMAQYLLPDNAVALTTRSVVARANLSGYETALDDAQDALGAELAREGALLVSGPEARAHAAALGALADARAGHEQTMAAAQSALKAAAGRGETRGLGGVMSDWFGFGEADPGPVADAAVIDARANLEAATRALAAFTNGNADESVPLEEALARAADALAAVKRDHERRAGELQRHVAELEASCAAARRTHAGVLAEIERARFESVAALRKDYSLRDYGAVAAVVLVPCGLLFWLVRTVDSAYHAKTAAVPADPSPHGSAELLHAAWWKAVAALKAAVRATWFNWVCILLVGLVGYVGPLIFTAFMTMVCIELPMHITVLARTLAVEYGLCTPDTMAAVLVSSPLAAVILPLIVPVNIAVNVAIMVYTFLLALLPSNFTFLVKVAGLVSMYQCVTSGWMSMPNLPGGAAKSYSGLAFSYTLKYAFPLLSTTCVQYALLWVYQALKNASALPAYQRILIRIAEPTYYYIFLLFALKTFLRVATGGESVEDVYAGGATEGEPLDGPLCLWPLRTIYNFINGDEAMPFMMAQAVSLVLWVAVYHWVAGAVAVVVMTLVNPLGVIAACMLVGVFFFGASLGAVPLLFAWTFVCCSPHFHMLMDIGFVMTAAYCMSIQSFQILSVTVMEGIKKGTRFLAIYADSKLKKNNSKRLEHFRRQIGWWTVLRYALLFAFVGPFLGGCGYRVWQVGLVAHNAVASANNRVRKHQMADSYRGGSCHCSHSCRSRPIGHWVNIVVRPAVPAPDWAAPELWTLRKAALFERIESGDLTVAASGGYSSVQLEIVPSATAAVPLTVTIERGTVVQGHLSEQPLIISKTTTVTVGRGGLTRSFLTYCGIASGRVPHSHPRSIQPHLFEMVANGNLASQGSVWRYTAKTRKITKKKWVVPEAPTEADRACWAARDACYKRCRGRDAAEYRAWREDWHERHKDDYDKAIAKVFRDATDNLSTAVAPNPYVITNALLWYRTASFALVALVGLLYAFRGPDYAEHVAPAVAWLCFGLLWWTEYQHGHRSGAAREPSWDETMTVSASIAFVFMVLAEIPRHVAALAFRLGLFVLTTLAYNTLADVFMLAGPDYFFGEVPDVPTGLGVSTSASVAIRAARGTLVSAIELIRSTFGLSASWLFMYAAVAALTARIRAAVDETRGEDLVQCALSAGAAGAAVIVFVAVTSFVTDPTSSAAGVLALPPPVEVCALMVCFVAVYGIGTYMRTFAMAVFGAVFGGALLAFVVCAHMSSNDPNFFPLDDFLTMWGFRGAQQQITAEGGGSAGGSGGAVVIASFSDHEWGLLVRSLQVYRVPFAVLASAGLVWQLREEHRRRTTGATGEGGGVATGINTKKKKD